MSGIIPKIRSTPMTKTLRSMVDAGAPWKNNENPYLNGFCHLFALALQRLRPDLVLECAYDVLPEDERDDEGEPGVLHVCAKDEVAGVWLDARGVHSSIEEAFPQAYIQDIDPSVEMLPEFICPYPLDDIIAEMRRPAETGGLPPCSMNDLEKATPLARAVLEAYEASRAPLVEIGPQI